MNELVVLSGKGGTGKTSISASFAVLARGAVVADCDVDAPDLHLLLKPKVREQHQFRSGYKAVVRPSACTACGACAAHCRFDAVAPPADPAAHPAYTVDPLLCEGCGLCERVCPAHAIVMEESLCGSWMVSSTRCGTMVHARLNAASGNSGKLVSLVRREARRLAETEGADTIIVDGAPGIGCPVIASVTGSSMLLVVAEPTVSGMHDCARVLELARHFKVPAVVCTNKWDISPSVTEKIEAMAAQMGSRVVGRIRFDSGVTSAQMTERAVVETGAGAGDDIRAVWHNVGIEGASNGM